MAIAGVSYKCDIARKLVGKLLDEVFGYKEGTLENEDYLGSLYDRRNTEKIPVEWVQDVVTFRAIPHNGFSISGHTSSNKVVLISRLHPVIIAFLKKEDLEYKLDCNPSLAYLLDD